MLFKVLETVDSLPSEIFKLKHKPLTATSPELYIAGAPLRFADHMFCFFLILEKERKFSVSLSNYSV